MRKIVHYLFRDIFTSGYIDFMVTAMDEYEHLFIMKNKAKVFKHGIKSNKAEEIKINPKAQVIFIEDDKEIYESPILRSHFYSADRIIISGLFETLSYFHVYDDSIWNKIYLHFWGGDFYCFREENMRLASPKRHNDKLLLMQAINRCAAVLNVVDTDYERLADILKIEKLHFEAPMPEKDRALLSSDRATWSGEDRPLRVVIGNSAARDNCHIEVFEKLSWLANENVDIYCPLAYGEEEYRNLVIEKGTEIFGVKIHFLTEYVPLDRYVDFLNSCDIGIYNNNRQQGFKNITTMLCLGKKVFLRNDTAIYEKLTGMGVFVEAIENIIPGNMHIFEGIDSGVRQKNRQKIADYMNSYRSLWEYVLNDKSQRTYLLRKNKPLSINMHITDHCNLNCKGCSHFAPVAEEYNISLNEFENEIRLIAEKTGNYIFELCLMGGEPLLHPNLGELLLVSRKYLPTTRIKLVTNGLKIHDIEDRVWEICKQCETEIEMTCYPISVDYDELVDYLRQKGVKVSIYVDRRDGRFRKDVLKHEKGSDYAWNYAKCRIGGLYLQIRDGKLFRCATVANIHILNSAFGTEFAYDENDYLPLGSIQSESQIKDFLQRPSDFCKYCDISHQEMGSWSISDKKAEEWIAPD